MVARTMGGADWFLLLLLSILWGGSFFFVEVALQGLPPLTIVALRVALAAAALQLIVLARGARVPITRQACAAFLGMGLLNNVVPFTLIVWGQTAISGGLASILNATTSLFTVVVAHFLAADERLQGGRLAGVLVGLGGVTIVIGPGALGGGGDAVWAQLAVLGAALCYALAGVFGRRFGRLGITPLTAATGQVSASALILVPLAAIFEQPWAGEAPQTAVWLAVVGLALLSTALAYLLYFRILASAGAVNLLLVTFLIPVSAIVLGALVLGERLDAAQLGGMAVIALGLALVDGRLAAGLARGLRAAGPAGGSRS